MGSNMCSHNHSNVSAHKMVFSIHLMGEASQVFKKGRGVLKYLHLLPMFMYITQPFCAYMHVSR